MNIKRLTAAALFATAMTASGASALTLKFDGWANGYKTVDVQTPALSNAAGAFKMKDTVTMDSLVVFCLDILGKIYSNKTYNYAETATPFGNSVDLTANGGIGRIQKIFDSGYDTALTNNVTSAGFQVALWNAVYDNDWSVSNGDGSFFETSSNGGVRATANAYLSAAQNYAGVQKWDLTYLEGYNNTNPDGSRAQNLVTATAYLQPLASVPLPAGGLMLIGALGSLVAMRRRKTA